MFWGFTFTKLHWKKKKKQLQARKQECWMSEEQMKEDDQIHPGVLGLVW